MLNEAAANQGRPGAWHRTPSPGGCSWLPPSCSAATSSRDHSCRQAIAVHSEERQENEKNFPAVRSVARRRTAELAPDGPGGRAGHGEERHARGSERDRKSVV